MIILGIILRRVFIALAGLSLSVAATLLGTVPAHAAGGYYKVCNSSYSSTSLFAYNNDIRQSWVIFAGQCVITDNAGVGLRIDPDNESGFPNQPDCNRWRIGHINHGYESWTDNDPDLIINPPNTWEDTGIIVHTD